MSWDLDKGSIPYIIIIIMEIQNAQFSMQYYKGVYTSQTLFHLIDVTTLATNYTQKGMPTNASQAARIPLLYVA